MFILLTLFVILGVVMFLSMRRSVDIDNAIRNAKKRRDAIEKVKTRVRIVGNDSERQIFIEEEMMVCFFSFGILCYSIEHLGVIKDSHIIFFYHGEKSKSEFSVTTLKGDFNGVEANLQNLKMSSYLTGFFKADQCACTIDVPFEKVQSLGLVNLPYIRLKK
jgi:hypothetical protein